MTTHEWRERTEDGPRLFRAERFGRRWRVISKLKSEAEWSEVLLDPPPLAVLSSLRALLWNKYQRKRIPWHVVEEIDDMIDPGRAGTSAGISGDGGKVR